MPEQLSDTPQDEFLHDLQEVLGPAQFKQVEEWHQARGDQLTPVQQQLLAKMYSILTIHLVPYHNQPPPEPNTQEHDHHAQATAKYDKAVLKALRHGLKNHPIIHDWWRSRAALGNRRVLRRAKQGLEKYAKKPYSAAGAVEAQAYCDTGQVPPTLNELLVDMLISDWRHPPGFLRPLPQGVTSQPSGEATSSLSPPRLIFNGSPDDLVCLEREQRREGKSLRSLYQFLRNKQLIPTKEGKQMSWEAFRKWVKRRGIL
jgi:hypothetical protein